MPTKKRCQKIKEWKEFDKNLESAPAYIFSRPINPNLRQAQENMLALSTYLDAERGRYMAANSGGKGARAANEDRHLASIERAITTLAPYKHLIHTRGGGGIIAYKTGLPRSTVYRYIQICKKASKAN